MGTCETGVLRCFDARHEASMWSEWLYTYMYSVCISGPSSVGMHQDLRQWVRQGLVAGDTPRTHQQDP